MAASPSFSPIARLHVYVKEFVRPCESRFVALTCSEWYVELPGFECSFTRLNCGLSTKKFSGNKPVFRTKPPPKPVTLVLRFRKSACYPTLPFAINDLEIECAS